MYLAPIETYAQNSFLMANLLRHTKKHGLKNCVSMAAAFGNAVEMHKKTFIDIMKTEKGLVAKQNQLFLHQCFRGTGGFQSNFQNNKD